ncbi:hypothetical protein UPYG_G00125600 [Umbra pygmaea]|uniref:Uncharacterized protein n=1 Tax=Umbra pygmaea TaxID=75934 RepID=A0ABD0X5Z7_UMBPY
MKIPLPHPHTLLKWLQTVNAEPGLNTLLLDMLQRLKNEDPVMYARVCLVLDGMSIRRQVQYDSHKQTMIGFVDLGSGIDETSVASEALVFMLRLNDGTPLHRSKRYLSVTGFVINIDSFTMMIPELLEGQRYVCTYRLSQDHLELFFNSIRASGGWNNNPTVAHFQSYFRRIMVRCGIAPGKTGNVQAQDDTMCLSAVDMSSVVPAEDDDDNIASSPFEQITGKLCYPVAYKDHNINTPQSLGW